MQVSRNACNWTQLSSFLCDSSGCPQHKCSIVVPTAFFLNYCDEERQKKYQDWAVIPNANIRSMLPITSCPHSCCGNKRPRTGACERMLMRTPRWNGVQIQLVANMLANIKGWSFGGQMRSDFCYTVRVRFRTFYTTLNLYRLIPL